MKKLVLLLLVVGIVSTANAQIKTPQPSPFSTVEQKVGLTDVTLEYSRPGVKGRTVFGKLVPFGKTWRTGANANTKITFSTDVVVDGKTLKKGTYAIYTIPNKNSWDVIFYSDATNWGNPRKWDDTKVVAKVTAKTYPIGMKVETFTMTFDDLSNNGAVLGMIWENTYIGVKFEVPTDKTVSDNISKIMNGPSAGDFYASAVYYLQQGKDINQAKTWIDKAVANTKDKPRYWYLRQQSLIHAKAGSKKSAIKAAKKSLELATEAKNMGYVKMNKEFLAKMK